MGTGVDRHCKVTFDKSKKDEIFKLVGELFENKEGRFHWGASFNEDMSLEEVFEEWGYELEEIEEKYNVTDFVLEKEGCDDFEFWKAIAPVIDSGSEIESHNECEDHYKWLFKDGTFEEKHGEVVYD